MCTGTSDVTPILIELDPKVIILLLLIDRVFEYLTLARLRLAKEQTSDRTINVVTSGISTNTLLRMRLWHDSG